MCTHIYIVHAYGRVTLIEPLSQLLQHQKNNHDARADPGIGREKTFPEAQDALGTNRFGKTVEHARVLQRGATFASALVHYSAFRDVERVHAKAAEQPSRQ